MILKNGSGSDECRKKIIEAGASSLRAQQLSHIGSWEISFPDLTLTWSISCIVFTVWTGTFYAYAGTLHGICNPDDKRCKKNIAQKNYTEKEPLNYFKDRAAMARYVSSMGKESR